MLLWQDLKPVQRQRAVTTYSARGEAINTWSDIQNLSMLIQLMIRDYNLPEQDYAEGVSVLSAHIGYCNLVTSSAPGAPATDLQILDRIVDINGVFGPVNATWRVELPVNASGVGDHYEVHLKTISPTGD
jgi:hypothetical protein